MLMDEIIQGSQRLNYSLLLHFDSIGVIFSANLDQPVRSRFVPLYSPEDVPSALGRVEGGT